MIDLTQIIEQVQREVEQAQEIQALIDIRVQYLGKKGVLTEQLKQLGGLQSLQMHGLAEAVES